MFISETDIDGMLPDDQVCGSLILLVCSCHDCTVLCLLCDMVCQDHDGHIDSIHSHHGARALQARSQPQSTISSNSISQTAKTE